MINSSEGNNKYSTDRELIILDDIDSIDTPFDNNEKEQKEKLTTDIDKVRIVINGLSFIFEELKVKISTNTEIPDLEEIQNKIKEYQELILLLNNYHLIHLFDDIFKLIDQLQLLQNNLYLNNKTNDLFLDNILRSDLSVIIEENEIMLKLINRIIDSLEFGNQSILSGDLLKYSPLVEFAWKGKKGGQLLKVSENILKLTGYNKKELYENSISYNNIIHKDDIARIKEEMIENTKTRGLTEFTQEYRIVTKEGDIKYILDQSLVKYDKNTNVESIYGYVQDITKQYMTDDNFLNELSLHNDLQVNCQKHIIILKIRNIDYINNLLGREAGNELLIKMAQKIKGLFPIEGNIYKISNTEFVYYKKEKAGYEDYSFMPLDYIENLDKELKDIRIFYDDLIPIHFEFGIGSTFFDSSDSLTNAYMASSISKTKGHPIIYTPGLLQKEHEKTNNFLDWANKLKNAINNPDKYFSTHLQGIYDNKEDRTYKYESLIRFKDGEKFIVPYFFLEHAEKIGVLDKILHINIDNVLKFLSENNDIEISLNCEVLNIIDPLPLEYLDEQTKKLNVDRNRIIIEVLENNGDDTGLIDAILSLKKKGYQIALDDFGTGSSNLERLIKVQPDYLKIDGQFIKNIHKSEENYKIVKSIVDIAHTMNAKVIAEFVDSEEVLKILKELGIDYSQGFLLNKPIPMEEIKVEQKKES